MVKAAVMVGASVDVLTMVSARGMGSVDMQMLEPEEILKPVNNDEQWWKSGLEDMTNAQDRLVAALSEVPSPHDCYEEIQGWIDRIGTATTDELTEGMQDMCRDFSDGALRSVHFSHRVQRPVAQPLVRLPRQVHPPGFRPRSIKDILKPWAIQRMMDWYRDMEVWLRNMAFPSVDPATGLPEEVKRSVHWSCVIGGSDFWLATG